jgi:xanthine dehydrogenase accessory factor
MEEARVSDGSPAAVHREISELLERHETLALATVVRARGSTPRAAGARMIVLPDGSIRHSVGGGRFEALVVEEAMRLLRDGGGPVLKSYPFRPEGPGSFGSVCGGEAEVFIEVLRRASRLVIVGGGHCGLALARAAACLDLRVWVVEDRPEFARPERFEGMRVERVVYAGEGFADLPALEPDDFVVLVSRGHETDRMALARLLDRPLGYLGMIGSRRRVQTVFDQLRASGASEEALRRVRAPIGIEIGADTPEEIAVSILAEIIKIRRLGT